MRFRKKAKKSRKALYMGIFIILIMVASGFAIILSAPSSNRVSYGDAKFYAQNNPNDNHRYIMEYDGQLFPTYYLPDDVYDINVNASVGALLRDASAIAYVFDPVNLSNEDKVVLDVVRFELVQYLGKSALQGVTVEHPDYPFPVMNCENATAETPIILFSLEQRVDVKLAGNCVIVGGRSIDLFRVSNLLLFERFDVRPSFEYS